MSAQIARNGGAPRIEGTRITVYDIMDYADWTDQGVAYLFKLTCEQVRAARQYIREHQSEVETVYRRILERDSAGNSPELRARLEETDRRFEEVLRQRGTVKEVQRAGSGGGRQH